MAKKSSSAGSKARATAYAKGNKAVLNATRRIARHLKKHPGDEQAADALKVVGSRNNRKKPLVKGGWVTESLRNALVYLPSVSAKGQSIIVRNIEHVPEMMVSLGQAKQATRKLAKEMAQVVRFVRKNPFQAVPVAEGQSLVLKHTSKLSNYHGPDKAA